MRVILGGGLIGLLAREILGPEWTIIPQGRSRYFSYDPPYADNHIIFHKDLDIFQQFASNTPIFWRRAISYEGALLFDIPVWARKYVADKIYGEQPHRLAVDLLNSNYAIYGCTAKRVHDVLVERYRTELVDNTTKYGRAVAIKDSKIITEKTVVDYERLVSTIPLKALLKCTNMALELPSRDQYCYDIITDALSLEGAQQVLVADEYIPFYKVNILGGPRYQFYTLMDLGDAAKVLGPFMKNRIQIVGATFHKEAIPIGNPPDLEPLSKINIECVGAEAQWDWFMDASACARRLLRLGR